MDTYVSHAVNVQPVTVETADGWLVISKCLRTGSVKPPYQYQYDADHWLTLEEAHEHYAALEHGEHRGWSPVAIVPCKAGVPLGSKTVV